MKNYRKKHKKKLQEEKGWQKKAIKLVRTKQTPEKSEKSFSERAKLSLHTHRYILHSVITRKNNNLLQKKNNKLTYNSIENCVLQSKAGLLNT